MLHLVYTCIGKQIRGCIQSALLKKQELNCDVAHTLFMHTFMPNFRIFI